MLRRRKLAHIYAYLGYKAACRSVIHAGHALPERDRLMRLSISRSIRAIRSRNAFHSSRYSLSRKR